MMLRPSRPFPVFILLAVLSVCTQATATIRVAPLIIDLDVSSSRETRTVTLANDGSAPEMVSTELVKRTVGDDGVMRMEPSLDILVFPPQFVLSPEAVQTLRIQWAGGDIGSTSSYYLLVSGAPISENLNTAVVSVGLSFSVSIHANPAGSTENLVLGELEFFPETGEECLFAWVENKGNKYGSLRGKNIEISFEGSKSPILIEGDNVASLNGTGLVPALSSRKFLLTENCIDIDSKPEKASLFE